MLISPFQGNAEQFRKATLIHDLIGNKIVVSSKAEADKGFSLGYRLYDSKLLGYNVVTNYQTTLSASISSSQTTIPVSTVLTKDGHTLTMDDIGDFAYLSVDTGSLREEIVKCTGISGSSFTGCSRGLAFYGTSTDPVIANQYAHSAGSKVVMSNVHYVYQGFVDRQSDETIAGKKTFTELTTFNELPVSTTTAPTSNSQLVNKKYVDDTVVAGGVPGTEALPGIFLLADKTQIENSTATSSYSGFDYNLIVGSNNVATSSQATTTLIATKSDGIIDKSFLDIEEFIEDGGGLDYSEAGLKIENPLPEALQLSLISTSSLFALLNDYLFIAVGGGSAVTSSNDLKTTNSLTYVLMKEIEYKDCPGTVNVYYEFRSSNSNNNITCQIKKNDVLIHQSNSYSATYFQNETKSNVPVVPGDKIQIYAKSSNASYLSEIINFQLRYGKTLRLNDVNTKTVE